MELIRQIGAVEPKELSVWDTVSIAIQGCRTFDWEHQLSWYQHPAQELTLPPLFQEREDMSSVILLNGVGT